MRKIPAISLLFCIMMSGCASGGSAGNSQADKEDYMYTFRKISFEEFYENTKQYTIAGEWVYEVGEAGDETYALFWGKARTLFGEPNQQSADWENMYTYEIEASDGQNAPLYLEVYHGSGGSSVAMPTEDNDVDHAAYDQAKSELIALIESAQPADYVWEGVYEDIPVNIKYTVKDGKATVDSKFGEDMF